MHRRHHDRGAHASDYLPLAVIVGMIVLMTAAIQWQANDWSAPSLMRVFMGLFLAMFAMFKLFDLPGFADGFQMYDLAAKHFRPYALVFPFLELGIGIAYLADILPFWRDAILLTLMVFGASGVLVALWRKLDVDCACLGTTLKVPLSTVAIVEDLGMAVMAAVTLLG